VVGTIRAYELIVATDWPDYVFDKDYDLMPLAEIEQYVADNGRLPGLPSAVEVKDHGLPVGESQALLLQKVEELTLHLIEQNKRLAVIQRELDELRSSNAICTNSSKP
jgi:hypothetical protein